MTVLPLKRTMTTAAVTGILLTLIVLSLGFAQNAAEKKTDTVPSSSSSEQEECKAHRPFRPFVSMIAGIDTVLDKLQKGHEYNKEATHPLYSQFSNWFPLRRDEIQNDQAVPLQLVEGELPVDLNGVALRVGPNTEAFNKKLNAIIDGDGMLHSIRLDGNSGRALYSANWIETPRRIFEQEQFGSARSFFLKLGEMKGMVGLFKLLLTPFKVMVFGKPDIYLGQANTALVAFDQKVYALQENALPFEIKIFEDGTFDSVGYETFGDVLNYPVSAHPRVDPITGEMVFHGYSPFMQPSLKWGIVTPSSKDNKETARVQKYIDVESPYGGVPFAHDFAITENYMLLLDSSVRFDFKDVLKGEVLKLDESCPLRIGICHRNATTADEIMWFTHDEAAALIHIVNAWEDSDSNIVLWAPLWNQFVGDVTAMKDKSEDVIRMTEFTFDVKDPERLMKLRDVENGTKHPTPIDFPAVNDNFIGRKTECMFAGIMQRNIIEFDGISKWHAEKGLVKNVLYGEGITGGEPIVAPKVGRGKEDSCSVYVLNLIHDNKTNRSYLVIYDGEDFQNKPVAKYLFPHRVPSGLHAAWVDADMLSSRT